MFVHKLDRFSTDIDLDLLDQTQEQLVINTLDQLLKPFGNIKNMVMGGSLHRRIISYHDQSMNIKVELNKRIWVHNHYHIVNIYGVDCKVMTPLSLGTNKLIALHERMANRDLYDTRFFRVQGREYDDALIRERTGLTTHEILMSLIKKIPVHYRRNTILFQLGEVLTDKQKSRVKTQLIHETINLLQLYIDTH